MIPNTWELLNQTLELLPSLDTRTVLRHTLVEGWNLGFEDDYAKLDRKAEPTFIEPKGFVFVGGSRRRMTIDNMPSHENIRKFGEKLASLMGYEMLMERADSRVVLLGKNKTQCGIK
jgi:tRNA wybutosine-synthesizing protein 1